MTIFNMTRRMQKLELGAPGNSPTVRVVFIRNDEPMPPPSTALDEKLIVVRLISPGFEKLVAV